MARHDSWNIDQTPLHPAWVEDAWLSQRGAEAAMPEPPMISARVGWRAPAGHQRSGARERALPASGQIVLIDIGGLLEDYPSSNKNRGGTLPWRGSSLVEHKAADGWPPEHWEVSMRWSNTEDSAQGLRTDVLHTSRERARSVPTLDLWIGHGPETSASQGIGHVIGQLKSQKVTLKTKHDEQMKLMTSERVRAYLTGGLHTEIEGHVLRAAKLLRGEQALTAVLIERGDSWGLWTRQLIGGAQTWRSLQRHDSSLINTNYRPIWTPEWGHSGQWLRANDSEHGPTTFRPPSTLEQALTREAGQWLDCIEAQLHLRAHAARLSGLSL